MNKFKGPPTILILDDNQESTDILKAHLGGKFFKTEVLNEFDIEKIKKIGPSLILLDIVFGIDQKAGIKYCEEIKNHPELFLVPVIFLTAHNDAEYIINCYRAGGVDFILKPINRNELINRVFAHLDLHERRVAEGIRKKFQAQLLHLLSHELINPVSSGKALFEILLEHPEQLNEYAVIIEESYVQTLAMIEKSREIVSITEDLSSIHMEFFSLSDSLEAIFEALGEYIKKKDIQIELEGISDIDIFADWGSFTNVVLRNLIHNAIKFSHKGGKVSIEGDIDKGTVRISIKDYGIGIPKQMIKDLFNIAVNSSRKGTEGEEGEGFGLPIARNQLTYFMGDMEIHSIGESPKNSEHGTEIIIFLKGRRSKSK